MAQLPPVLDLPLCVKGNNPSKQQQFGRLLYEKFKDNYILTESMRQAGDSNAEFRGFLTRLATGGTTLEDWHLMGQHSIGRLDSDVEELFQTTGTKLCARKVDSVRFNQTRENGKPDSGCEGKKQ